VRFAWDEKKGNTLKRERGYGFDEVVELFQKPYHLSRKQDDPEQWRAIGWVKENLVSLIYEEREEGDGAFYWLVTYWTATKTERKLYREE
jgi:uncharacterized DUF497 family protein